MSDLSERSPTWVFVFFLHRYSTPFIRHQILQHGDSTTNTPSALLPDEKDPAWVTHPDSKDKVILSISWAYFNVELPQYQLSEESISMTTVRYLFHPSSIKMVMRTLTISSMEKVGKQRSYNRWLTMPIYWGRQASTPNRIRSEIYSTNNYGIYFLFYISSINIMFSMSLMRKQKNNNNRAVLDLVESKIPKSNTQIGGLLRLF